MICTGMVAFSRPPGCGGPKVRGVDIETIPGVERERGVSWVGGTVEGVLRNGTITVTKPFRGAPARHAPSSAATLATLFPSCPIVHRDQPTSMSRTDATAIADFSRVRYPRAFSQRWFDARSGRQAFAFVGTAPWLTRVRTDLGRRFRDWSFCVVRVRHRRTAYRAELKRLRHAQAELGRRGVVLTGSGGGDVDRAEATVELADPATLRYLRHRFPLVSFTSEIEVLSR